MATTNGAQRQNGGALRVAQIGCGQISSQHLRSYRETALADLAVVCDVDPEAAREASEQNGGVPWTTRFEEAIARDDVDFVSIATPHYLHAPMTAAAARAGKHVLCEKPLTISLAAADEMIGACRDNGVRLGMWMVSRYSAATRMARALLRANAIGRIVNIRLPDVHHKAPNYYQRGVGGTARPTDWRPWRARAGGGALIMNAIHQIDALRYITGLEVERVAAEWVRFSGLGEVEDMIAVLLRYDNGAIGSIDTANYAPGGGEAQVLRIYGSQGQLTLGRNPALRAYVTEQFAGGGDLPALTAGEWQDVPLPAIGNTRTLLLDEFVRAVAAGQEPPVTGLDGRRAIETVLAAYDSAERGESITLPLVETAAAEPALAGAR